MRNLRWILIFQIFLLSNLQSQPLTINWQQCYTPRDVNQGISIIKCNNGYALFCYISYTEGSHPDWWLVRTDTSGEILWSKTYGGSDDEYTAQIKPTPDGGMVLSGTTFSINGNVQGNHGGADYWVVKVDSLGNIQWQKCLGGTGYDFLTGIDVTSDSGYICVGRTTSNDGQVTGFHGFYDYWVVRLDQNGNIKWEKCYGGSGGDYPSGVTVTSDGGAVVYGDTYSTDGDVHFNLHGGQGIGEAWIIKIDSSGDIQWENCYGGTSYDNINIALSCGDGGYICAGSTSSNDGQVSGNHGDEDVWIIKIDHWGNLLWQKCYGGSLDESPYCMKASSDGNFFVGGYTYSHDGDVSGNHSVDGYTDMWLIKISPDGELIWQQCIGGDGDEALFDFLDLSDGKLSLLGYSWLSNSTGDVTCDSNMAGRSSAWLVSMTDNTYTGIDVTKRRNNSISVYPNPANQNVIFEYSFPESKSPIMIIITDELGKITDKIILENFKGKENWNTQYLQQGLYFYHVINDQSSLNGKIIIIK
jgi:hypothetical protein